MSADSEEAASRASEKKDDDENGVEVDGDRVGSSGPENGAEEGAESASAESATVGAEGATGSSESKESNGGNKGDGDNEDGKDDNDADDDSDDSGGDSDDSDSESSGDSSSSEEEDAATARARREAEAEAKKAAADSAAESKKAPPKKKGGLFGRLTGRGGVQESSSSSSEESEDEVDLFEVEAETIEECVEALKLIEQVDSDWDILLDAPSDWDSDDSENKPTAPILRSSCGTLSIETTQIREDVLRDLIESRQTLKDAQKELQTHEEDEYMKYFYDTLSKLRVARDKAAKRVNEEESRLELYSQKDEGAIKLGAALRFNEHLMSLTMCDAEIGPVGATALSAAVKVHPTLTHLSLKHNPLLAEGAEAIFRATRRNGVCGLAELDLYDCAIGPEGATMLAAQLYKNKTLEDLRLRYNQMGPEGALAIASMLMENRVLVDLDLMLNEMQMAGGLAFERVLKNTVIVEVDKGDDISKLKKLLKLAKKKITDPFWDDVKAGGGVDTSGGQKVPGQVDDREDGEKGNSAEGEADLEEGDLKGEESVDKQEHSEESEEEEDENSVVDGGGGESKADASKKNKMEEKKKKPKKLSRRAQRKADAEKAERDRKIRANLRFWMRSTLYTYDEVKADYHAQFMRATKRRSCSLVLFAGTITQCAKALEFFDNETWAVAINPKNDVIKEINLGQNNFERDFRRQPGQMKRLLGSTIKGLWQDVADFFRPTIMNF